MFTLKLYQADKIRIVECESVTVYRWANGAAQVTLHQKPGGFDSVACVGDPPPMAADGSMVYDRAIVENASGKTTEMIYPEPRPGPRAKTLGEWDAEYRAITDEIVQPVVDRINKIMADHESAA